MHDSVLEKREINNSPCGIFFDFFRRHKLNQPRISKLITDGIRTHAHNEPQTNRALKSLYVLLIRYNMGLLWCGFEH